MTYTGSIGKEMVNVYLAEGFEEIEAISVIDVLRRQNHKIQMVSLTGNKLVKGAHGINIEADILYENVDLRECEMIVLPGGVPGIYGLEAHDGLKNDLIKFMQKSKYVAAICAAPSVLAQNGLLSGRKATINPKWEKHLMSLDDVVYSKERVVVNDNLITSQGPGTAFEFAITILELLEGEQIAEDMKKSLLIR